MDWTKTTAKRDEKHLNFGIWWPYIRGLAVVNGYEIHFTKMAGDPFHKNELAEDILKGIQNIVCSSNFLEFMEYLFNWL